MREIDRLARMVVERMKSVYRPEYYDKCVVTEPESLLGLIAQLDVALVAESEVNLSSDSGLKAADR